MDPERRRRLVALGNAHDAWAPGRLDAASGVFDPSGRKASSDYGLHHVDLDADDEAFQAEARRILGIPDLPDDIKAAAGISAESRPLTPEEQAAGLDPAAIQAELDAAHAEVTSQWDELAGPLTAALVAAVLAALAADTLATLGDLAVPDRAVAGIRTALAAAMRKHASVTGARARRELEQQGITLPQTNVELRGLPLAERAAATAQLLAQAYASSAGREGLRLAGATPKVVETAVRERLDGLTEAATGRGYVAEQIGHALFAAEHAGRGAVFELVSGRSGIRFASSEYADGRSCEPCRTINGRKFDTYEQALAAYPSGGYRLCLGGDRCRGRIIALNDTDRNRALDIAEGHRTT